MAPLPAATSKTTPSLGRPPFTVVPNRSPWLSSTTPPAGSAPSLVANDASVVIVPVPAAISNTVPALDAPPFWVVPNRSPAESSTTVPLGLAPSVPLNVASTETLSLAGVTSKTVP